MCCAISGESAALSHALGGGNAAAAGTARSMPTRKLLRQLGIRFWRLPRMVRAFQAAMAEHAGDLQLHDGITGMLRGLSARGHRLGILSSNREDVIRTCLRANGVEVASAPPALRAALARASEPVVAEWVARAGAEGEAILATYRGAR